MTNYAVVQSATASDAAQPGDSVTLTCSVFSDDVTKSCGDEHSVLWFRVGSEKSHPNIIYTDGNRRDGCDDKPDARSPAMSCFSKTVNSSDTGTYYCAVASCGEILFGNGTKLDIEGNYIFIVQLDFPYYWIFLNVLQGTSASYEMLSFVEVGHKKASALHLDNQNEESLFLNNYDSMYV